MRHPLLIIAAALTLGACGERAPEHVAWPDGAFAAAFLADASGGLVSSIAGPFQLRDGAAIGGDAGAVRTVPEPGALLFIGLTAEAISARSPLWNSEPPGPVALLTEPESCTGGRREVHEEGTPRYHRLSALMPTVLRLDESDRFVPAIGDELDPAQLSVRVAEDPRRCVPSTYALVEFGARARLLEGVESVLGRQLPDVTGDPVERYPWTMLSSVAALGEGRAVAASQYVVYVFELGGSLIEDERHVWFSDQILNPALPGRSYELVSLHLDPRSPFGDRWRLILHALTRSENVAARRTALVELWLGPTCFEDPRILFAGERQLQAGRFEPSGRFIGVGSEGLVVFVDPETNAITETTLDVHGGLLFAIELTDDPARPHVVATKSTSLFIGDLAAPNRALLAPADPVSLKETTVIHPSRSSDGRARVLVSTYDGGYLMYEEERGWRSYLLDFPPDAIACAGQEAGCGAYEHHDRFVSMTQSGPAQVLGASYGCSSIFELDLDRGCVEAVPLLVDFANAKTERADVLRNFRALGRQAHRTLVSGYEGTVLMVSPLVD